MFYVTTTNPTRAAEWEHIFGTAHLPVLSPYPRRVWEHDRHKPPHEVLVYDLNVRALHSGAVYRLAFHVARVAYGRMPSRAAYHQALTEIRASGVRIPAEGCVVDTAVSELKRPFFVFAREHHAVPLTG